MTNIARARRILDAMTGRWGKPATTRDAAQALADAGLLMPDGMSTQTETVGPYPRGNGLHCKQPSVLFEVGGPGGAV